MPFADFIGNPAAVDRVRELVASRRARRTLVLSGPAGVGKTTLALMAGLALNCLAPPLPGDFCGACSSCASATPAAGLDALQDEALSYRAAEVKSNPREAAPLVLAPHPAVRIFPPDGDMLTIHQARSVIHLNQLEPDAGRTWCLVLPELESARWTVQAALLKTLEEPAPRVAILALVRNPLELLPTVRSRALVVELEPVPPSALAATLAPRLGIDAPTARLRARLAQGAPGRALSLDLDAYRRLRADAFALLATALAPAPNAATLVRVTESTRVGKEKFESLLDILYSVIQDILYLQSGFADAVRNVDATPELEQLAGRWPPEGVPRAIEALDRLHAAARRNVFRPLGLQAWALDVRPH